MNGVPCLVKRLRKSDWTPERFSHASHTLEYEGKQVGAIEAKGINDVIGMLTKPSNKGHGTQFLKMMIGEAKRQGKKNFIIRDVIGETKEDQEKLEHILEKLGFRLVDKEERIWELVF